MPTAVEVLHDDGRWYLAELLGQHRDPATDGLSTDRLGRPLPGPTARAGRRATRSTSRGRAGAHGRPGGPAQAWGVTSADGSGSPLCQAEAGRTGVGFLWSPVCGCSEVSVLGCEPAALD